MTNNRKDNMKKYKVGISELGYEQVVEAEDEQEAEEMALIHCKQYLHEYVDVDTLEEVEWKNKNTMDYKYTH